MRRIFHIVNRYRLTDERMPYTTGHWVAAIDADDAIRIATTYGIANPWGREPRRRIIRDIRFNPNKNYHGQVWVEHILPIWGPTLMGYATPLSKTVFKKGVDYVE